MMPTPRKRVAAEPPIPPMTNGDTPPVEPVEMDSTPVDKGLPKLSTVGKVKTTPSSNANLAGAATQALLQVNSFAAFGGRLLGYDATAEAIDNAKDEFQAMVYDALLLDQELCKWIMRGGTNSGKIALVMAYLMLGAAVVPVATIEYKAKKAAKEEPEKSE